MARPEDIAALEALTPWDQPAFRAGLALLSASTAAAARQYAADARVLAALAAQVPRCAGDETGASPWTSFRREVAVARQVSDQAAAAELRTALRLTGVLACTLALLEAGRITVSRARTLAEQLEPHDDTVAAAVDAELAERAAALAPWRIKDAVRRAVLRHDPDAAAVRAAAATAARDVRLVPADDGQATVVLTGPAVPLTRWYATLDRRARALRTAVDPRTLAALRFDLAVSRFPCTTHSPATSGPATSSPADAWTAAAGLRPTGVEAAAGDCRLSRPVQAVVLVPVETALGLSNDPAWLDGYGWIDAPTSRQLLVDAELRQACTRSSTGALVDGPGPVRRPPPDPSGLRAALLSMVTTDPPLSDVGWRTEPEHDPSTALRDHVILRDRFCDGPTQPRTAARHCDLDHTRAHPHGPTAAWNLAARSRRTHQLKHAGWTPLRTARSTLWTSPAGQLVDVPHPSTAAPGPDLDPHRQPELPDPDLLVELEQELLSPAEARPWLPADTAPQPRWTLLEGSDDCPF